MIMCTENFKINTELFLKIKIKYLINSIMNIAKV